MADEMEFVKGLIVKAPRDGAPDFVKCAISIKITELREWLDGREGDWVNLDVKESKGGRWYAAVNTFKPKREEEAQPQQQTDHDVDIPF